MNSAAGILKLIPLSPGERDIVHTFGVVGAVMESAASEAMERELSRVDRVGKPLRERATGALWKTAKVLTVARLLVSLLPGQSRRTRRTSGIRDPRATFGQQRAGFDGLK